MEILEYIPLLSIVRVVKEIAELLFYSFAIVYIVKNIKKQLKKDLLYEENITDFEQKLK